MRRDCFRVEQRRRASTQKSLSKGPSLGLGWLRFRTVSCCRSQVLQEEDLTRMKEANEHSKPEPEEAEHRGDL